MEKERGPWPQTTFEPFQHEPAWRWPWGAAVPAGTPRSGSSRSWMERGFDIVSIAGTSMGAVVGGLYAAGGLDAYSEWGRGLAHRDVLRLYDLSPRAPGAIRGDKIFARVSDILGDARIEDLPLPFTAVATDLMAGEDGGSRRGRSTPHSGFRCLPAS